MERQALSWGCPSCRGRAHDRSSRFGSCGAEAARGACRCDGAALGAGKRLPVPERTDAAGRWHWEEWNEPGEEPRADLLHGSEGPAEEAGPGRSPPHPGPRGGVVRRQRGKEVDVRRRRRSVTSCAGRRRAGSRRAGRRRAGQCAHRTFLVPQKLPLDGASLTPEQPRGRAAEQAASTGLACRAAGVCGEPTGCGEPRTLEASNCDLDL